MPAVCQEVCQGAEFAKMNKSGAHKEKGFAVKPKQKELGISLEFSGVTGNCKKEILGCCQRPFLGPGVDHNLALVNRSSSSCSHFLDEIITSDFSATASEKPCFPRLLQPPLATDPLSEKTVDFPHQALKILHTFKGFMVS